MARKILSSVAAAFVCTLACSGVANKASAAVLSGTYKFTFSNFYSPEGDTSPFSTITGTFTLNNLDTSIAYSNDSSVVTLNSLTPGVLSSTFGATTFTAAPYAGNVFLGGIQTNSDFAASYTNDIVLGLDFSDPAHPVFLPCSAIYSCSNPPGKTIVGSGYTTALLSDYFQPQSTSASISLVPLPAAFPMLAAALLAVGAIGCCVKRKDVTAA